MIKLCIDGRMINSSGIGTYLKNILKNLDQEVFDIYLIIFPSRENIQKFKKHKLISCKADIYSTKEQFLLSLKIPKCDIFWSPHFNIPIFPIRAKKRIVTIHDLCHMKYFKDLSWLEKIYAKIIIPQAIKRSNRIFTDSIFTRKELIKYFPFSEDKIKIIYLSAARDKFKNSVKEDIIQKVLNKYNLFSKYFLFVGNFKRHKNLKNLIKAFKVLLKKTQESCSLVIVGKKEGLRNSYDISSDIKNLSLENKIHILTNITDEELAVIYFKAIAFVFPSFYEGFGFPPLEAMCCNVPVIASKVASIPEVCGDAAYYVDPSNYDEIAKGMLFFLNNENNRQKYIRLGNNQKKKFCWKKATKMYEEIFIKVANEDSGNS